MRCFNRFPRYQGISTWQDPQGLSWELKVSIDSLVAKGFQRFIRTYFTYAFKFQ